MEVDPVEVERNKLSRLEAESVYALANDGLDTQDEKFNKNFWNCLYKLVKAKHDHYFPVESPPAPMTYEEACRFELSHSFPWGRSVRESHTNYIAAFAGTSEFKKQLLRYMASSRYRERQDKGE